MGRRKSRGKKKAFKFTALGSIARQVKMAAANMSAVAPAEDLQECCCTEDCEGHSGEEDEQGHGHASSSGAKPKEYHHLHFEQEVSSDSGGEQDAKKLRRGSGLLPPDFERDPELREEFERCSSSSSVGSTLENMPDEPVVDKCGLDEGDHGLKMCLSRRICDLCYLAGIRNFGRPLDKRMSAFCFKIPSLLSESETASGPTNGVEYPIMESSGVVFGKSESVKFNMNTHLSQCPGSVIADLAKMAITSGFVRALGEEKDEEEDEDGLSTSSEDEEDEECCESRKAGCRGCCTHDSAKLRGMKDWRPEGLPFHDQQFILRQAKKYQVDVKVSHLLQFILATLKSPKEVDGGMAPKQVPKFARTKVQRKKIYTRKSFPEFDLPKISANYMARPYAYLELLDHNKEDGILLISLAEMIGISRRKEEMITVFEKNFGFDCRMEQFKEDEKKRHHTTGSGKKK